MYSRTTGHTFGNMVLTIYGNIYIVGLQDIYIYMGIYIQQDYRAYIYGNIYIGLQDIYGNMYIRTTGHTYENIYVQDYRTYTYMGTYVYI